MLKDTDKFENSSHFTYNEYPKKVKKPINTDIMIFVSVFIIGLLIILGFAKILSPNVDVAISVSDEAAIVQDDDNASSVAIDDRLHHLKLEDDGKKEGDEEMFSPELDEKVILPQQQRKTVGQMEAEMAEPHPQAVTVKDLNSVNDSINNASQNKADVKSPKQSPQEPQQAPKPVARGEQIVNAKVVVGSYATEKQAEVAKSIIQDAGLGVVPIVKNIGGYYTLQVGSYSSREKAQQAANGLLKSNFPARVVE